MAYTLEITELTPSQVDVLETTGTVSITEQATTVSINYNAVDVAPAAFPTGGTTGQILKKASATDYDTVWGTDEETLSNNDSDDLTEGTTNLYYTDTRARASISSSGDLAYNATTGVVSYSTPTIPADVGDLTDTGSLLAGDDLSNNTTTQLAEGTNLYYTDARVDTHLTGGTGVTYATGDISIGQPVSTTSNVTFNDMIVSGNLTVSGETTTVSTETIELADNIILFNSNEAGVPSQDAGIEIERGTSTNKTLIWDESEDKWSIGSNVFVASTFEGSLSGNVTGTVSDLSNHNTADLAEGTNLYYTDTRADARVALATGANLSLASKTTADLAENTNLYFTTTRADARVFLATGANLDLSGKNTSALAEGTNLYYTDTRADARVALATGANLSLSSKTTADLAENTNLYYTDTRADARIALATGANLSLASKDTDDLTEGSTNLYYTDARSRASVSLVTDNATALAYNSTTGQFTYNDPTGGGPSGSAEKVIQAVRNTTGSTIVAGAAVYISGSSGNNVLVSLADANGSGTMPAAGIVLSDITNNNNGEIVVVGEIDNQDTSAFSENDTLYVSETAGGLTATRPTSSATDIQSIGRVAKSHASTGIIIVTGAGRLNDVPNLATGTVFIGNGSGYDKRALTTLDVSEDTNLYYTDTRADARANTIFGNKDTDDLTEGTTNLYYTDARAQAISINNVVEDVTPQLGAALECEDFGILNAGASTFLTSATSGVSAAVTANASGNGAPSWYSTTGYMAQSGNAIFGRNYDGAFIELRSNLHIGAALQNNYSIQTSSFSIDPRDSFMHVVDLSGDVTATFDTTTINRSNANGPLGDSGHVMQYEFYANQDATGGHALTFAKSGGGVTPTVYGTQTTTGSAKQFVKVRCFHANSGGFNAIHVHWE
tara:strand:+ start:1216 stop:3915 length:2700 start_codon:yes stop_codon:yes gene_type:complete